MTHRVINKSVANRMVGIPQPTTPPPSRQPTVELYSVVVKKRCRYLEQAYAALAAASQNNSAQSVPQSIPSVPTSSEQGPEITQAVTTIWNPPQVEQEKDQRKEDHKVTPPPENSPPPTSAAPVISSSTPSTPPTPPAPVLNLPTLPPIEAYDIYDVIYQTTTWRLVCEKVARYKPPADKYWRTMELYVGRGNTGRILCCNNRDGDNAVLQNVMSVTTFE